MGMVHDVLVIGATIAGLTAARRLAAEGFDVVVLDPSPDGVSAAIGHGVAARAAAGTVASLQTTYGHDAALEHVRRTLAGVEEVADVLAAGEVPHSRLELHDRSLGATDEWQLSSVSDVLASAGAEVSLVDATSIGGGTALVSEALVVDPRDYARALSGLAVEAGAAIHHDVTVVHLVRRDGVSVVAHRSNVVFSPGLRTTEAVAVIDTLGISPWGRAAGTGPTQYVPWLRFRPPSTPRTVSLDSGGPVWMVRPMGDEAVAHGPAGTAAQLDDALTALEDWVEATCPGAATRSGRLTTDPSDHGRPVAGVSAIPGGFYARGNGRHEMTNGTASGCYLAAVLLGESTSAHDVALPWTSRLRAGARGLARRLRRA